MQNSFFYEILAPQIESDDINFNRSKHFYVNSDGFDDFLTKIPQTSRSARSDKLTKIP